MSIMHGLILIQGVLGLTTGAGAASVATGTMSLGVRDAVVISFADLGTNETYVE